MPPQHQQSTQKIRETIPVLASDLTNSPAMEEAEPVPKVRHYRVSLSNSPCPAIVVAASGKQEAKDAYSKICGILGVNEREVTWNVEPTADPVTDLAKLRP